MSTWIRTFWDCSSRRTWRRPAPRRSSARPGQVAAARKRPVVVALFDHLTERAVALRLTIHLDKTREYLTKLTSLVTALAMNYLYTDRFFEVD